MTNLPEEARGLRNKIAEIIGDTGEHVQGALTVDQATDAILSALTAEGYVVVMGWQPIETAPKDGTAMLAYLPDSVDPLMVVEVREFEGDPDGPGWYITGTESEAEIDCAPTHWMPLPAPPAPDSTP